MQFYCGWGIRAARVCEDGPGQSDFPARPYIVTTEVTATERHRGMRLDVVRRIFEPVPADFAASIVKAESLVIECSGKMYI